MTATAATAPLAALAGKDPIYTVNDLSTMGFGHPTTIRGRIHKFDVPIEELDGRGKIGVRESNLHMLRIPVHRSFVPTLPSHDDGNGNSAQSTASAVTSDDFDDLAALAARMVATWPRLSEERKRELGALLATP